MFDQGERRFCNMHAAIVHRAGLRPIHLRRMTLSSRGIDVSAHRPTAVVAARDALGRQWTAGTLVATVRASDHFPAPLGLALRFLVGRRFALRAVVDVLFGVVDEAPFVERLRRGKGEGEKTAISELGKQRRRRDSAQHR